MNIKQKVGKKGEDVASEYLNNRGYKILTRNFRGKYGEIDIIATDRQQIIFVEVKTRTNLNYGRPAEAVTKNKQMHIEKTAQYYVYKNKLERKKIRFDIVEVYFFEGEYKIKHIKNVM